MPVDSSWERIVIPQTISGDVLDSLDSIISGITAAIGVAVEAVELAATVFDLVAFSYDAVLQALIDALDAIIKGLIEMGITYTAVIPTLGNLHSAEEALELLARSVEDEYDLSRPNTSNTAALQVSMICFVVKAGTLPELFDLINSLRSLINFSSFENSIETVTAEAKFLPLTGGEKPDWNSAKLVDAFPFVGDLLQQLDDLIALLPQGKSFGDALHATADMLRNKAIRLQQLSSEITAAFELYLTVVGLSFDALVLDGIVTNEELKLAIRKGIQTIPNNQNDNIGAVVAISNVVPSGEPTTAFFELFGVVI